MNSKLGTILISLGIAFVVQTVIVIAYNMVGNTSGLGRFLILLGGELPLGIIQFVTYFLFFFGLIEIRTQNKKIDKEEKAFEMRLLPEKDNWVLSPDDVAQLKLTAAEKSKRDKYQLLDLIKKVCTKYRSNKSTSEVLGMLSTQVRINLSNAESEQSMIRYTAWAIPSIGFIGTIIGIANSLGFASEAGSPEGIAKVTSALNVAFDTTLVSLFLSLFLMLFFHIFQERVEKLHSRMEAYILENLVNRIYHR